MPRDQALDVPRSSHAEELSQFERLLAEISARFINLPPAQIDDVIDGALQRILDTLRIDRCSLSRVVLDSANFQTLHSRAAAGVVPVPKSNSSRSYPWALARFRAGEALVFSRPDELPPEASVDRASYQAIGLGSHVGQPVVVAGKLFGVLGFGSIRRERTWPDELVARMRLLADVFGNALARKLAQEDLDRTIGFERLATRILAARLIAGPADDDRAIELALREIGEFLGVERASLWERLSHREEFRKTHGWRAAGAPAPIGSFGALDLPWVTAQLIGGSGIRFTRDAELPPEAAAELPRLRELGLRSLLGAPFSVAGEIAGALFFANIQEDRTWPESLASGVKLLAEVFASLHARQSTERRKQAAEVEAAQWRERLAHLVRVHTAGEMSAALAHEITQPLGAIENYALAARRRIGDDSPDLARVADLLDKVISQAARAGGVVTRMRGMVQRHELDPKEIDVERAVGDCVDMVKTDCELRGIRVELKPAGPLPVVVADPIHLQQVVLNLLRNAMEALELPRPGVPKVIAIEIGQDAPGQVSVNVADNGAGIAEGDLERVFESFYSTKSNGLGIGLAICRKLIEAHGGALWASHNPGGGAVFHFTLPVAAPTD
jgi:signal transduction histidine kinase